MTEVYLVILFLAATAAGYRNIRAVPTLLHTPLMSGMNALSGVTVLGAMVTTAASVATGSAVLAAAAVVLATVNVVAGFLVTHRMLRMFRSPGAGARRRGPT
ncbi:MAG TPA: proton-translocating transhydrogenase family protein [Phycisphaerae bacterium]|nr:proton-translocating transhydrogenase family protein [Phycisphaerae bacterium]